MQVFTLKQKENNCNANDLKGHNDRVLRLAQINVGKRKWMP